jgi:hypothetical protein
VEAGSARNAREQRALFDHGRTAQLDRAAIIDPAEQEASSL